ncbi:TlpA family protein disulfide reductase [Runella zeae]|uniref:TlpA family protein disulfide reductase n=1 Tax=Runella zeae TaxID=94255 RepID=UPI0023574C71|nr:TlpA disulfide reductase family protein [Runella zeae]
MRYYILWILFLCSCGLLAQNVIIKGKILYSPSDTISLYLYPFAHTSQKHRLLLDKDGFFELKTTIPDVAYLYVEWTNSQKQTEDINSIIIEPNDTLVISFEADYCWTSLKTNDAKIEAYQEDYLQTVRKEDWKKIARSYKDSLSLYFEYLQKIENLKLRILEKYKPRVSRTFYTLRQADIKTEINSEVIYTLYQYAKSKNVPLSAMLIPSKYRAQRCELWPTPSPQTAKAETFPFNILYLTMLSKPDKNIPFEDYEAYFKAHPTYFHPAMRPVIDFEFLKNEINDQGNSPAIIKKVKNFKAQYPTSLFVSRLEQKLEESTLLRTGKEAFPFILADTLGNKIRLSDFKGKVVFLDFWASWCAPCIAEIEHTAKIKEYFKNDKEVVFVYISTDSKQENWKKAIAKYQIGGVHLIDHSEQGKSTAQWYNVSAIPRYVVIDREGRFHTLQPPLPSLNNGEDLIKVLTDALLKD